MQRTGSLALTDSIDEEDRSAAVVNPVIPDYLQRTYWWAYLHPRSVSFFEQQWVINTILWGNYARLRDAALNELGDEISGRTLQVACVYGNLTAMLAERLSSEARLDVVDVAPIQLENLRKKVSDPKVQLHCQDASDLTFADSTFEKVLIFFLLHELPPQVRKRTIQEALRVLKPNGRLIILDYHRPARHHPHRYIMQPVFRTLEPFALELWNSEIVDSVEAGSYRGQSDKACYFGGLYQKVVITR